MIRPLEYYSASTDPSSPFEKVDKGQNGARPRRDLGTGLAGFRGRAPNEEQQRRDFESARDEQEPPIYVIGFGQNRGDFGSLGAREESEKRSADVGLAITSNNAIKPCPLHGFHRPGRMSSTDPGHLSRPDDETGEEQGVPESARLHGMQGHIEPIVRSRGEAQQHRDEAQRSVGRSRPAQRTFGLAKDLSSPTTESAHIIQAARGQPVAPPEEQSEVIPYAESSSGPQARTARLRSSSSSGPGAASKAEVHAASTSDKSVQGPASPTNANSPPSMTQFSIEVVAPSFDKRGYPIFSGRGAQIRGFIRLRPVENCEVVLELGAHISQGSPAAIWDGIALMPPESGEDRKIFTTVDTIKLDSSMLKPNGVVRSSASESQDQIMEAPFDVNLPVGVSSRMVNGAPSMISVSLPPSYEVSSDENRREREASRTAKVLKSSAASVRSKSSRLNSLGLSGSGQGFSNTMQSAVERGFGEVFRIGCFYTMKVTLQKSKLPPVSTGVGSRLKTIFGKAKVPKPIILDTITVPFIFLGEPTNESLPPHTVPTHLIAPAIARADSSPLGRGWEVETGSANWSGPLLRSAKRNVDLELHLPSPPTMHTPCIFAALLIIRPADPCLLSAITSESLALSAHSELRSQRSFELSSRGSHTPRRRRPSLPSARNDEAVPEQEEMLDSSDNAFSRGERRHGKSRDDGRWGRFLRGRLSTSRKDVSDSSGDTEADGFHSGIRDGGRREVGPGPSSRPTTAPTSGGSSSGDRSRTSSTTVGPSGTYYGNLSGLVSVSLVQTTFCVASGPLDPPKNLRKLVSVAEVEELHYDSLFISGEGSDEAREIFVPGPDTDALKQSVRREMKEKGVRVLKATFRIGTDATPSFRCHGVELKYAIKVDLVPFSIKDKSGKKSRRPGSSEAWASSSNFVGTSSGTGTGTGSWGEESDVGTVVAAPTPQPGRSSVAGTNTPAASSPRIGVHDFARAGQTQSPPGTILGGGLGGSGGAGSSTIIAGRAGTSHKLEKGVGSLFAPVRMVRGAYS